MVESHINLSVGSDISPPPRWRIKDQRKVVSEINDCCSANEKPLRPPSGYHMQANLGGAETPLFVGIFRI